MHGTPEDYAPGFDAPIEPDAVAPTSQPSTGEPVLSSVTP